jgi:hypothetical protein
MPAPTHLLPLDFTDTLTASSALFERIAEATNTIGLKNKWFFATEKQDVIREIMAAGEGAAKEFARSYAPNGFRYEKVIRYVLALPNRQWLPTPVPIEEIQFRVHINGGAYERLVAAVCSKG